jgi:hypothetical protein
MARQRLRDGAAWLAFTLALVLATAPVWQRTIYGFHPTLDQLLRIVCSPSGSGGP